MAAEASKSNSSSRPIRKSNTLSALSGHAGACQGVFLSPFHALCIYARKSKLCKYSLQQLLFTFVTIYHTPKCPYIQAHTDIIL